MGSNALTNQNLSTNCSFTTNTDGMSDTNSDSDDSHKSDCNNNDDVVFKSYAVRRRHIRYIKKYIKSLKTNEQRVAIVSDLFNDYEILPYCCVQVG